MSGKEEAAAVPSQAKGSWMSFVRSMANFNGDLSSLTAPPFILSTTSLTEFSAYWACHPSVFVAPAKEKDPEKRALLVLKWFLTTLRQQYCSRNDKYGSEKKPLNPFLGEIFLGHWQDEAGRTELISEQVSHHPPVTAYCIFNKDHGIRLQGYNAQKASFSSRIDVRQIGHAELHLQNHEEYYVMSLPSLHIEGLVVGAPFVELNHSSWIRSSSGYTAKIDYKGRGWVSGKKNTFVANLYKEDNEKTPLYTLEGQWSGEFTIKDHRSKSTLETWNGKTAKTTPLNVPPIEQQDPLESRRAWRKVADAIGKGDMNTTSYEKSIIENAQRELRRKEREETREWERVFFTRTDDTSHFDSLARHLGESIEADKTNGAWRFDTQKAEKATKPYKQGVMPEQGVAS